MTTRKPGVAALLQGCAVLAALSVGIARAGADEAPDLSADQRLLDSRVNQLVAAGQQPGAGNQFSLDRNPALGAAATGGSFPRSILIPGTDTSFAIYGRIVEYGVYLMSGGVPNGLSSADLGANGLVQAIPLRGTTASTRGDGIFYQTPQASRIYIETRTPTPLGEARTVFAWDWASGTAYAPGGTDPTSVSDNLVPRLLYAYGTLGGLLAGQALSNFSDNDANSEVVEFGGNVGDPGRIRAQQVRYTVPAWWGTSVAVSVEDPETNIATPQGIEANDAGVTGAVTTSCPTGAPGSVSTPGSSTCTTTLLTSGGTPANPAKTILPDLTASWYFPEEWGHVSFGAVLRPGIEVTDGRYFTKDYVGYGGRFGGDIKPGWFGWGKDDITVTFVGGDMIGGYLNSSTNFDLATNYGAPSTSATIPGTYGGFNGPTSAASAAKIIFKPTQELGADIGYQHWWLDNLRSNINAGFNAHYGIPISLVNANGTAAGAASSGGQAASLNKELITAHVNLIWSPVSDVDLCAEYMWGQRTVLDNQTATLHAIITKIRVMF